METQFDDEPIDYIDCKKSYFCSPITTAKGFNLLMKWCLMYHRDPNINDRIVEHVKGNPASLNQKNNIGWTPLMFSVRNSQTVSSNSIVLLLIQLGADINARCNHGWTALMSACRSAYDGSDISTIKILLDRGADPNIKNIYGATALYFVDHDCINIYSMLIDNGANVNHQDKAGDSPLFNYLSNKDQGTDIKVIQLFLDVGADITLRNNEGKTALDYTHGEVKDFILQYEVYPIKEPAEY